MDAKSSPEQDAAALGGEIDDADADATIDSSTSVRELTETLNLAAQANTSAPTGRAELSSTVLTTTTDTVTATTAESTAVEEALPLSSRAHSDSTPPRGCKPASMITRASAYSSTLAHPLASWNHGSGSSASEGDGGDGTLNLSAFVTTKESVLVVLRCLLALLCFSRSFSNLHLFSDIINRN